MKLVSTLDDLDRELAYVDERFAVSDDEGRKALAGFSYALDRPLPWDPYGPEYRDEQMRLYHLISGRPTYDAEVNEVSPFVSREMREKPFPYSTRSPRTVGEQLIMQGWLIREMDLPAPARLVEFGPGWGNTTLHFAMMGYEVTAVEVWAGFIDLIRHRTADLPFPPRLVQTDMLAFDPPHRYDAAVFFESFHHCADHVRMLRNLDGMVAPGGKAVFAAEPITDFPFPWGVRLDGMSVWSIRKFGWLELGFDNSYFLRTLLRLGWTPRRRTLAGVHGADVIVAERSGGVYRPAAYTLPPDEAAGWHDPDAGFRFTTGTATLSLAAEADVRGVEFTVGNFAPFDLPLKLTAGDTVRTVRVPKGTERQTYHVPATNWDGAAGLACGPWQPAQAFPGSTDRRWLGVPVHEVRLVTR